MRRPTVNDIAREAGVSLATVDRVLNARAGVRPGMVGRVNDAIERLGYVRDLAAANLARRRDYRVAFVLPDSRTGFLMALRDAIAAAARRAAGERMSVEIVGIPAFDSTAYARALDELRHDGVHGVALLAPETPQLRDAIRRMRGSGAPVVAFVSDQPHSARDHFVGVDNVAAGRTAGVLLGRFLGGGPATVLVIAGSMMSRDAMERRLGFDAALRERFPKVTALPTLEGRDNAEVVAQLLRSALTLREVDAIYAMGAGQRGLVSTLGAMGLAERVTVVAHELTAATRAALLDGTIDAVITQDVGHLARSALRVLRARIDRNPVDLAQEQIRIEILVRENLARAPEPERGSAALAVESEDAFDARDEGRTSEKA